MESGLFYGYVGLVEVPDDRDAVRAAVEDLPGVPAGLRAVDHGDDLVAFRVANEPVRGLARVLAEVAVAEDRRALHVDRPPVVSRGGGGGP